MVSGGYYEAAQVALYQWGRWVKRPPLWAALHIVGMFSLLPIPSDRHATRERRLDPFSRRIHDAVLGCSDVERVVLWGYYVERVSFDSGQSVYRQLGLRRTAFYTTLQSTTMAVYSKARS
jgi:hypothetical protein